MKAHFYTVTRPMVQLSVLCGLAFGFSAPAHAVDGCKLLLCMAGNWRGIAECVPTVRQALRDVARGRAWPQCAMASGSGSANQYVAPEQCPPQYVTSAGTDEVGRTTTAAPSAASSMWPSPASRGRAPGGRHQAMRSSSGCRRPGQPTPTRRGDGHQFDRDQAAWAISEQADLPPRRRRLQISPRVAAEHDRSGRARAVRCPWWRKTPPTP